MVSWLSSSKKHASCRRRKCTNFTTLINSEQRDIASTTLSTGKEKEQFRRMHQKCQKRTVRDTHVTDKSDLPAAEALFGIFADCPETGMSSTWALEAWE